VRGAGSKLVFNNGSQPTASRFLAATGTLGIDQVFTSHDDPKGNKDS